ncbi:MAG TPA: peptidase C39 family protein [Candidatus Eremiobacteraceae bacterium]|nr:peptidase C39 family protein [Candidatus Eremiobacteraceae bacterium]
MGNLAYAALLAALSTLAGTHIVNGGVADPNDRIWFVDPTAASAAVERSAQVPGGFVTAIASWNVQTPGGSSVAVELRARIGARWTRWYSMGMWSADLQGGKRRSVDGQKDADGRVDTDTLTLAARADAFDVRVTPSAGSDGSLPVVRLLAVATSLAPDGGGSARPAGGLVAELPVPERSQRIATSPDAKGGGGDSWCSPTSVSMVMAYWARVRSQPRWDIDVAQVADGVYDPVYDGCGNWPFNVAFASEHGLAGFVRQFPSLDDVAQLVARGVPVIASIAVKPGELDGTPYPKTEGHLLVVRGFTSAGDVIVNDPYALPGAIRRVYRRDQFARVWQGGSNGTVYIIAPPDIVQMLR